VSGAERSPLARVAWGLLAALVVTNGVLLALLQTGGPLIGLVFYAFLLWRWHKRDYRAGVIGGIVGLAVHVVEVATAGWSAYPILMVLNLALPATLALVARSTHQRARD
jgi:hypothetical protein